ncbi:MAG: HutD family protein [Oscillospiraceae bacterium]|nr:HutD family protein [Oscillospiraceae bacterium]
MVDLEKLQKIPHPGLRNIKTALAATICIVLYTLVGRIEGLPLARLEGLPLACIAVFICVQDSVDKSWKAGRDRALGTLLGGAFASIAGIIMAAVDVEQTLIVAAIVAFVGIVLYIFACNLLKIENSIVIGLATYTIILFSPMSAEMEPVLHALNRTLDTLIGIVIGCSVNILLFRPRPERFRGCDTVNPVFHYERRQTGHHKTVRWEGGYTEELYIYPEDALYQNMDFDFRVAVNRGVVERGCYRTFPGFKRQTLLLDGEIHLTHKDAHDVVLGPYEQDVSLGDWETACSGHGTDMTLLTAEGVSGRFDLLYCGERLELANSAFVSLYCLRDGAKLYLNNARQTYKEELAQGDLVLVSWFPNGNETYQVEVRHETEESTTEPLAVMVTVREDTEKE